MKTKVRINMMGEEKEIEVNHPDKNYVQVINKYPSVKYKNRKKSIPRKNKYKDKIKWKDIF